MITEFDGFFHSHLWHRAMERLEGVNSFIFIGFVHSMYTGSYIDISVCCSVGSCWRNKKDTFMWFDEWLHTVQINDGVWYFMDSYKLLSSFESILSFVAVMKKSWNCICRTVFCFELSCCGGCTYAVSLMGYY